MYRYCYKYVLITLLSFFCDVESGLSQVDNFTIGKVISIDLDSLPCYEKRIEQTGIRFEVPYGFNQCKLDSIRFTDCVFKYMPSLTNLRPGIIQSHDKHVLILLYPPYLFTAKDSIEAVKARLNRLDEMYASKDSIQYCHDVIDFNKYSPNKRHRYYMQDYSDRIELYPSKIAKAFFNADSMFIWRRTPEETNILFLADTVNVAKKLIQQLDGKYDIKDELFWNYYPYCKTMVFQKNNVGYIPVYIYFTKKGLDDERKYIYALKRMFWFQ